MATGNTVPKLYKSVINDVIANMKESFLDEGIDEQVLEDLRSLWEKKLTHSKAVDFMEKEEKKPPQPGMRQYHLQQPHASFSQPNVAQPVSQQQPVTQVLPAFNPATGQFEVSAAAAQAQTALGNLLPGSTVTIQMPQGPMQFLIQPQITQQLQQHAHLQQQALQQSIAMTIPTTVNPQRVHQLDGADDSSSDDDDDDDDDDDEDQDDQDKDEDENEEEPLNSNDDVTDDESGDLFEADNMVVCQFDKIHHNKNRWKFYLKDGIMNLCGKDYVFQKCIGDADW